MAYAILQGTRHDIKDIMHDASHGLACHQTWWNYLFHRPIPDEEGMWWYLVFDQFLMRKAGDGI